MAHINRDRKQKAGAAKKPRSRSFFKREATWMSWMNLAPFGTGIVIALIFWFTR